MRQQLGILLLSLSMLAAPVWANKMTQRPHNLVLLLLALHETMHRNTEEKQHTKKEQQKELEAYFNEDVFPLVPQALANLRQYPICPGPCCPETIYPRTRYKNPHYDAARLAFEMTGKKYCRNYTSRKLKKDLMSRYKKTLLFPKAKVAEDPPE